MWFYRVWFYAIRVHPNKWKLLLVVQGVGIELTCVLFIFYHNKSLQYLNIEEIYIIWTLNC